MSLAHKVEAVERLASSYRAVMELAEELKAVGSIDNAREEAERALAAVREQVKAANGELEVARVDAARVRSEAETVLGQTRTRADALLRDATAEGERLEREAKEAVKRAHANALAKGREAVAAFDAGRRRAHEAAKLADDALETARVEKAGVLSKLEADLAARSSELADVEGRLARVREQARAVLEAPST